MKKLLSLIVIATLGFVSCSKDKNESFPADVTGVWVLDSFTVNKAVYLEGFENQEGVKEPNTEADYNSAVEATKGDIGKEFSDYSIKLGKDGVLFYIDRDSKDNLLEEWIAYNKDENASSSRNYRYIENDTKIVTQNFIRNYNKEGNDNLEYIDEWVDKDTYIKSGSKLKKEFKNAEGKVMLTVFLRKM